MGVPTILYGVESWTLQKEDVNKVTAAGSGQMIPTIKYGSHL